MKKILSSLYLFLGISALTTSVVSCNTTSQSVDLKLDNIYWYDLYNQRYNKTYMDMYTNIDKLLYTKSAMNFNYIGIQEDSNIIVKIYDENNLIKNNNTKIDINKIQNDKFSVSIDINKADGYFKKFNKTFNNINLNSVNNLPEKNDSNFNKILGTENNAQIAYNNVRNYIANYINQQKGGSNNSNITENNIKNDMLIGISLWNENNFISDNIKNTDSITSIKITIGSNIIQDQYFKDISISTSNKN